jgi:hypothetical protein
MALGPRDTSSLGLVTGWDATELEKFRLRDGVTAAQVVADANLAIGALNAELYNDPLWSMLIGEYTDELTVEYRVGTTTEMELHTEYGRPDAQRADVAGHMLPLRSWDYGLGWTWDYLRKARSTQLQADITAGVNAVRNKWRVELLTRLLKRTDDSGAAYGLGTTGYSAGFATTAAQTNVDFIPPAYGGTSFTNTHEHYVTIAGGAWTVDVFKDIRAELMEHGHMPSYEVIISSSDVTTVQGLTGFAPVPERLIRYSASTELANFNMDENAGVYSIGAIHDCRVWVVPGLPQYYGFGWRSYGRNNPMNPLKIRLDKGVSRPTVQLFPDPTNGSPTHPLQYGMFFFEFGVGVGDRTNGTARYNNHANTWTDGTPT